MSSEPYAGDPTVAQQWDEIYAERERMWSGEPNGALVAETAGLTPGRVLDVGCGEGADAVWLARRGWDVTALEVSGLALARARQHAADAGTDVRWVHADLVAAALPPRSFDLVSAMYPALLITPDGVGARALLDAVAVGGRLLFVHHRVDGSHHGQHDGQQAGPRFDPDDYVMPQDVAALLDADWVIETQEDRDRHVADSSAGAHHVADIVLRARRLR